VPVDDLLACDWGRALSARAQEENGSDTVVVRLGHGCRHLTAERGISRAPCLSDRAVSEVVGQCVTFEGYGETLPLVL
jgi:hypothetical protein